MDVCSFSGTRTPWKEYKRLETVVLFGEGTSWLTKESSENLGSVYF